jgi:hypothetical protein
MLSWSLIGWLLGRPRRSPIHADVAIPSEDEVQCDCARPRFPYLKADHPEPGNHPHWTPSSVSRSASTTPATRPEDGSLGCGTSAAGWRARARPRDATAGIRTPAPGDPETPVLSDAEFRALLAICAGNDFHGPAGHGKPRGSARDQRGPSAGSLPPRAPPTPLYGYAATVAGQSRPASPGCRRHRRDAQASRRRRRHQRPAPTCVPPHLGARLPRGRGQRGRPDAAGRLAQPGDARPLWHSGRR